MSGIEIAGLVLGALPLIFSAIEHYKSGLDGPMAFFRWAGLLEKAVEELWIQYTYYEITLKTLLKDIKTTSELEEMMSAPDSPLWKDQDLEAELKIRLGNAYGVFVHTTKQIESQLESLAKSLNIDKRYVGARIYHGEDNTDGQIDDGQRARSCHSGEPGPSQRRLRSSKIRIYTEDQVHDEKNTD